METTRSTRKTVASAWASRLTVHIVYHTANSLVIDMPSLRFCLVVAILFAAISAYGQSSALKDQITKSLGKDVTIKEVTTRYDFSGLSREIPLTFERFQFVPGEQPSGYTESASVKPATPAAQKLWTKWEKVLPEFAAPTQKFIQAYKGKQGGVILYFRWSKPLPDDARKAICRVLYGKDEKVLGSDTKDDLLVSNNWCMIWSFAQPTSELKQAHQKRTFEIVNQEAQQWMQANPEKAKKFLQPKK